MALVKYLVAKAYLWVFWHEICDLANEAENGHACDAYRNGLKRSLNQLNLIQE